MDVVGREDGELTPERREAGSKLTTEVWVDVPIDPDARAWMKRLVDVIGIVAVLDALLLIPLIFASVTDSELISILGPIHGVGFLALVFLCVRGVSAGRWGWWWPVLVVITLGPIGSLIGDYVVRREIRTAV